MEILIITIPTLIFLSLNAYEHKWFLKNLHDKTAEDRKYAQGKWHFWANAMRMYFVAAVMLAFYTEPLFTIGWNIIPMGVFVGIFGGFYFSIFLNKIRGLNATHRGNGWWDKYFFNAWGSKISLALLAISSVLTFILS